MVGWACQGLREVMEIHKVNSSARDMGGVSHPIFRNVELLRVLLGREIAARTSGTLLGAFWMLLQPALQTAAIWFLLQVVLKIRYPELKGGFVEYYLAGMVPWLMLSEIMLRSLSILQEYASIYQRTAFPIALIPLLPPIISGAIYISIYIVVAAVFGGAIPAATSVVYMVLLLVWLLPVIYLLALIGVFIRDAQQIAPFILTMMLYLTPIFYLPTAMPQWLGWWLVINPFAHIVEIAHAVIGAQPLHLRGLIALVAIWLLLAYPTWRMFRRVEPMIREAL